MTSKLIALFAALLACSSASALEVVLSEHRDTHSFQRISEFFTGGENPGRYTIARTDPERRDGFYVGVKASKEDPIEQYSSARISYIKPASQEIHSATIKISGPTKKRILVGLTEEEWADPTLRPQAWKIELLGEDGQPIDSIKSFLWSLED